MLVRCREKCGRIDNNAVEVFARIRIDVQVIARVIVDLQLGSRLYFVGEIAVIEDKNKAKRFIAIFTLGNCLIVGNLYSEQTINISKLIGGGQDLPL